MDSSVRELFDIGKQYFDTKNYFRAEQYFLKIVKQGVRFADVLNMLGIIYHHEGKFSDAIHCFQNALSVNPNYTEATLNLAVLYNDLGEYPKAKKLYQKINQRKKDTTDIDPVMRGKISNLHANLADTYRSIGRYKDASGEYKKALSLNPHFVDIRTRLGICLREEGLLKESLKELTESTLTDPDYIPAKVQRGVTLYSMKRTKEAMAEWQAVLKKDPKNPKAAMYVKLCETERKKS